MTCLQLAERQGGGGSWLGGQLKPLYVNVTTGKVNAVIYFHFNGSFMLS